MRSANHEEYNSIIESIEAGTVVNRWSDYTPLDWTVVYEDGAFSIRAGLSKQWARTNSGQWYKLTSSEYRARLRRDYELRYRLLLTQPWLLDW